jgi:hypothetical protein
LSNDADKRSASHRLMKRHWNRNVLSLSASALHDGCLCCELPKSLALQECDTPRFPKGREAYPTGTSTCVTNTSSCKRRAISDASATSKNRESASTRFARAFDGCTLACYIELRTKRHESIVFTLDHSRHPSGLMHNPILLAGNSLRLHRDGHVGFCRQRAVARNGSQHVGPRLGKVRGGDSFAARDAGGSG